MKCVHLLIVLTLVTGCASPLPGPVQGGPAQPATAGAKPSTGPSASAVSIDALDAQYEFVLEPNTTDQEQASSGMTYVVVKVTVHNSNDSPVLLNSSMFDLIEDRTAYSPQTGHVLEALEAGGRRSILFNPLNPGQDTIGFLVFQVPMTMRPPSMTLRFRLSPQDQVTDLSLRPHSPNQH